MEFVEKLRSNFAANLVMLREQRKLTQAALVDALNSKYRLDLKRASVANYESGEAMPKIETLFSIAQFFETSIDEILKENPVFPHTENQTGDTSKNQSAAQKPDSSKNDESGEGSGNCEGLRIGYAQALEMRKFYVEFTRRVLNGLVEMAGTDVALQTQIRHTFGYHYVHCMRERTTYFKELAENILEREEYAIFTGSMEGCNTEMLAYDMNLPQETVMKIFDQACMKIRVALDNHSK